MPDVSSQVQNARSGTDPAVICRVPSGWVVMCQMQFLPGYCILEPDPVVASINQLELPERTRFLLDMIVVGDALLQVTGAFRINYCIAGNSDPVLHAHIVPRYDWEPAPLQRGLPWSHPQERIDTILFDPDRDAFLMQRLREAITARIQTVI